MLFHLGILGLVFGCSLMFAPRVGGGWLWDLLNGLGFLALALILALFGDTGRGGRLGIHRWLGWAAFGLVLLHAVGLLVTNPVSLEYLEPKAPLYMGVGLISMLLLGGLALSAEPRYRARFAGFPAFLKFHGFAATLLAFGALYHVVASALYFEHPIETFSFTLGCLIVVLMPRLAIRPRGLRSASGRRLAAALALGLVGFVCLKHFS